VAVTFPLDKELTADFGPSASDRNIAMIYNVVGLTLNQKRWRGLSLGVLTTGFQQRGVKDQMQA
jgi:hypothetical protein